MGDTANDPVADMRELAQDQCMRLILSSLALIAAVSVFPSLAGPWNVTDGRKDLALKGEIFAEVYARPDRLRQIENEVLGKGWKVDCAAAATAQRFIRVQLPNTAAFDPDIQYFVDLKGVSKVQMVYETMTKEPCNAGIRPDRGNDS